MLRFIHCFKVTGKLTQFLAKLKNKVADKLRSMFTSLQKTFTYILDSLHHAHEYYFCCFTEPKLCTHYHQDQKHVH